MKKPPPRPEQYKRASDNDKRRLMDEPTEVVIENLSIDLTYGGSSKHKQHPHLFGLPDYRGRRGDRTLCDRHAGFRPEDMSQTSELLLRGLRAGLIGKGARMLWSIADNGWIFEARNTTLGRNDFHGYPVLSSEAIAEAVYRRFQAWADRRGSSVEKSAASACQRLYGFR